MSKVISYREQIPTKTGRQQKNAVFPLYQKTAHIFSIKSY